MTITDYLPILDVYAKRHMSIKNATVYNMWTSLKMAGLPMVVRDDDAMMETSASKLESRGARLGKVKMGTGHDCYLKGILVTGVFSFPQYMWQQAKRYHWFDMVSSMSTMHKVIDMANSGALSFTPDTPVEAVDAFKRVVDNILDNLTTGRYSDKELFQQLVAAIPSGLMLPAGISTNYLQLKTMYHQRKNHKLDCWREFCEWCESLPMFKELIGIE